MRIALVLDPSAVVAYCRVDIGAHEVLGEVAEDDTVAALPAAALAEARAAVGASERFLLGILAAETPHVVTLPLLADDALGVGALAAHLDGSLGLAHAIQEVRRTRALLLTARATAIRKAIGELHGLVDLT